MENGRVHIQIFQVLLRFCCLDKFKTFLCYCHVVQRNRAFSICSRTLALFSQPGAAAGHRTDVLKMHLKPLLKLLSSGFRERFNRLHFHFQPLGFSVLLPAFLSTTCWTHCNQCRPQSVSHSLVSHAFFFFFFPLFLE